MNYKIKNLSDYELKVSINLSENDLKDSVFEAEKELSIDLKLKGFRSGKVPHELAKEHLNKDLVSKKALDIAVKESFIEFLKKEKIDLIEASEIKIEQNSKESLIYSVTLIVYPKFKLKDYKGIRVKKCKIDVTDEEINGALKELYQFKNKDSSGKEKINDEFAKSVGNFNNLEELKSGIRSNLRLEKEKKEKNKIRVILLKEIADSTKIETPKILIDRQLDLMIQEFDRTLHGNNMELSVYLAGQNKTQDDLKKEWIPKAKEKIKAVLILKEIAKIEKIEVKPEEVEVVMNDYLSSFGAISPHNPNTNLDSLKENIYSILINEKVLSFLEDKAEYY